MAGLSAQYKKRLQKEFASLQSKKPQGITISMVDDNIHDWEAIIPGPEDSLYKGGRFKVRINVPEDYPLKAPMISFATDIYHLNVHQKSHQVCLGFLSQDKWTPACNMEQVLNALFSLLSRPETENSMDHDLLNEYHHYCYRYENKAKESAAKAK